MKVDKMETKKFITKYEMRTYVESSDCLNDQMAIAERDIESIKKYDNDEKYNRLIGRVSPFSARREIEAKIASGEFTKEEVIKKLYSKLKSTYKKELADYSYTPEAATSILIGAIRSDSKYDKYEKLAICAGIKQYVEKYGAEKANEDFRDCLRFDRDYDPEYDRYLRKWVVGNRDDFKLLDKKYASAEEVGREKFSPVVSSSFTTYYYYKVKVKILNDEFDDIITLSSYYSGGWD